MALALYSRPSADSLLSSLNPFTITFDGRTGGEQDKLVYIRNDATDRYYDDIVISVIDTESPDLVSGSIAGFVWKLMRKDIAPTNEEWSRVEPGNSLALDVALGDQYFADIVTFIPVWVRVGVPRGIKIQTITDIVLRLDATEHAI